MRRRTTLPFLVLATALVLSACNIVIGPPVKPPTEDATITATSSKGGARDSEVLGPGDTFVYRIDVGSLSKPLLYVELSKNVDLTLINDSGYAISSSSSNDYFAGGVSALSVAGATPSGRVAPQDIGVQYLCDGSCVIQPLNADSYYARVTNSGNTSTSVSIWAYGSNYNDTEETANDAPGSAPTIPTDTTGAQGAIETIGDVDYWIAPQDGQIYFDASQDNPVQLRLLLHSPGGSVTGPFDPNDGQPHTVYKDWIAEVYSVNDNRGGTTARSSYFLSYP